MTKKYFNHHANRVAIEISVEVDNKIKWNGTGFFVEASKELEEGPKIYCTLLISNKHVLARGVGTQRISLNKKNENGEIVFGQQDKIEIERSNYRYTGHKDDEIDLACLDMRGIILNKYDVPVITSGFLQDLELEKFGVGSEVLYAGYPNGMKDSLNGLALMRKGSVASIPTLDCNGKGLNAIDGTVMQGNSGSPVFIDYDNKYRLLGVMCLKSMIADDYGFVIKQQYVNQLINQALENSASDLRNLMNSKVLEKMRNGPLKQDVKSVTEQIWHDEFDQSRSSAQARQ